MPRRVLLAGAFLVLAPGPLLAATRAEVARDLTTAVAMPVVERFDGAARELSASIDEDCGSDGRLGTPARMAFAAAVDAWARLQPLAFGPLLADNRLFALEFWPDKHGVAARQMRAMWAAVDVASVDRGRLAQGSVATQGLTALEEVLFDPPAGAPDDFRCAFATGLARNIEHLAGAVASGWTEAYASIASGATGELSPEAAAEQYFRAMVDALEQVAELRLARPLGASPDDARGGRAEFAASGLGMPAISGNLETARDLFTGASGEAGLGDLLDPNLGAAFRDALSERFEVVIAQAGLLEGGLAVLVETPEGWAAVDALRDEVKALHGLLVGPYASDVGFTSGFNATDGD